MKLHFNFKNLNPRRFLTLKNFRWLLLTSLLPILILLGYTAYNSTISPEERLAKQREKELRDQLSSYEKIKKPKEDSTPEEIYSYHAGRYNYLAQLGDKNGALEELIQAGNSGAKLTFEHYLTLGSAYEEVGNKTEAKKAYETALVEVEKDQTMDGENKQWHADRIKEYIERNNRQ